MKVKDQTKYSQLVVIMSIFSHVFLITVTWQLPCNAEGKLLI